MQMVERERTDVSDGVSWYCPRCYTRKTIREGSFFAKSRLSLQKWLLLMYMWVRQYPVTDACEEVEVDQRTGIDVYQWLREVCSQRLISDPPIVLGGPNIIVQIDESLFRHKPKVRMQACKCKTWLSISHFLPAPQRETYDSASVGVWTG